MPPSPSQSSFIPKRGASRSKRHKPARRVFLFTILAYSLIFASLLASGASYLYKNYVTSQLQEEVAALNTEISTFSISDLARVSEFDFTLKRAVNRLDHTASIVKILDSIDEVVAEPVQILALDVIRENDEVITVIAEITSRSFDSALFQRKILNINDTLFSNVTILDVSVSAEDLDPVNLTTEDPSVKYKVVIQMPIDMLPYEVSPGSAASNLPVNTNAL